MAMAVNTGVLREIGLSDSETSVYLSLLRHGPCLASRVASDSGLNRTHVYSLIESLLSKGIANYAIRENRKYFTVVSPRNLLNYVAERKRLLEQSEKDLQEMLPELERMKKKEEGVSVEVFKGVEGTKTLLNHVVSVGEALYVFPYTGSLFDLAPIFYRNWIKRMESSGIQRHHLSIESKRGLYAGQPSVKVRFLPPNFNFPVSTWVYGDYAVIFIVVEEITLIRVHSRSVARVYRNFFNELWGMSKK